MLQINLPLKGLMKLLITERGNISALLHSIREELFCCSLSCKLNTCHLYTLLPLQFILKLLWIAVAHCWNEVLDRNFREIKIFSSSFKFYLTCLCQIGVNISMWHYDNCMIWLLLLPSVCITKFCFSYTCTRIGGAFSSWE